MSLLSTRHVEVIEAFLARNAIIDHHTVDHCRNDPCDAECPAAGPAATEVALVGERLTIALLPDLDLPGGWLSTPVDASVDAVGIVAPVDTRGYLGAIVDRAGSATWFSVEHGLIRFGAEASCQLLDDLARSRLGLATAPPGTGTDWYWLGCWLHALGQAMPVVEHHRGGRDLDAVCVAGWHPAIDPDDLFGLDFHRLTSLVVGRHRDHAAVADWECVRLDARSDRDHRFHHLGPFRDEGGFSRWVGACSQSLSALAGPLMVGCSPLALRLIGAVIADVVIRQRVP
jgi:hypothetical protein